MSDACGEQRITQTHTWTLPCLHDPPPPPPQRITHRPDLIIRKLDILQVKRAIGAALIEENIGLFAEADAYSEILGDVQLDTEALLVRRQLCSTPQRTLVRRSCILV